MDNNEKLFIISVRRLASYLLLFKDMVRILSIFVLPILAIGVVVYLFPTAPAVAKKAAVRVTQAIIAAPSEEPETTPAPASAYEQLQVPNVTVGPEFAQLPEIRIWAIRNDTNYGWIQLPRGTQVSFIRQDGEYYIVRYEETIIRAHRSVVDSGMIILKKSKTYAAAY